MNNYSEEPYICPKCKKKYPQPPKACSCERFEIIEETKYFHLMEDPGNLEQFQSVIDMGSEEITEEEFMDPTEKGFYIEEIYVPGIETLGSYHRTIKKVD